MDALIQNDAAVLGLLITTLALIFYTSHLDRWAGFYKYIPALLLCYFLPAAFNSMGIIDGEASGLYTVTSRYLLPASIVLLCLSIDLKAIWNLGPKALIMFFSGTVGVILGGPTALLLVSQFQPELLGGNDPDALWRGLSTIAGSWIGGGPNQTAMKEIAQVTDEQFSAMLIVDVLVANLWMPFLLVGAGMSAVLDRRLKADSSAVEALKIKVEALSASQARIPNTTDLMIIAAVAFGGVGVSHLVADGTSNYFAAWFGQILASQPHHPVLYLSSLGSGFFWLTLVATLVGIAASFTPLRRLEGAGASKYGSLFIYLLVATIGMKMDVVQVFQQWDVYGVVILIGILWMLVHIVILLLVAKLIRAPFFFVAVGSQANIGGAASAPVVASAFSPALAPVGVLLAVLGYAVGTVGAIISMELMHAISM
jgi:uncharacterized membrane protein